MSGRLTKLSRSVAGKRVIVTGAASGMGRATAHLFADEGARVAVVDLDPERVLAVGQEIRDMHGPDAAIDVVCDVADLDSLKALVATVVERLGGIDILVNNAGVSLINSAFQDEVVLVRDTVDGPMIRQVSDRSDRFWDVLTWRLAADR